MVLFQTGLTNISLYLMTSGYFRYLNKVVKSDQILIVTCKELQFAMDTLPTKNTAHLLSSQSNHISKKKIVFLCNALR